jgi:hypothetical protein
VARVSELLQLTGSQVLNIFKVVEHSGPAEAVLLAEVSTFVPVPFLGVHFLTALVSPRATGRAAFLGDGPVEVEAVARVSELLQLTGSQVLNIFKVVEHSKSVNSDCKQRGMDPVQASKWTKAEMRASSRKHREAMTLVSGAGTKSQGVECGSCGPRNLPRGMRASARPSDCFHRALSKSVNSDCKQRGMDPVQASKWTKAETSAAQGPRAKG